MHVAYFNSEIFHLFLISVKYIMVLILHLKCFKWTFIALFLSCVVHWCSITQTAWALCTVPVAYLTRARRKGGNWRDIQNLQVVHNTVKNDRGSVDVSRLGGGVSLGEVIVNKLTDYRSFPDSRRSDDGDAQRFDHPVQIRTADDH